jgi:hypothetical protein
MKPILDPKETPKKAALKNVLGNSYEWYEDLEKITNHCKKEWIFLKGTGWVLSVNNGKRDLFYLIPQSNYLLISLTFTEKERKEFLNNPDLKALHAEIENTTKFSEGDAMQFAINSHEAFSKFSICVSFLDRI